MGGEISMTDGMAKNQTRKAQRFGFLALRYFEWVRMEDRGKSGTQELLVWPLLRI
jgi:hypothetical protein